MKITETVNIEVDKIELFDIVQQHIEAQGYKCISMDFDHGCTGCGRDGDETADHELTVQATVEKIVKARRRKVTK